MVSISMDTTNVDDFDGGHHKDWFDRHLCEVADVYVWVEIAPTYWKSVMIDRATALDLISGPGKKYGFVSTSSDGSTSLFIGSLNVCLNR